MNEIDIERIAGLSKIWLCSISAVVVGLQLNVRAFPEDMLPTSKEITARYLAILFHVGGVGCCVSRNPNALSRVAVVEVTLNSQGVAIV